MMASSLIRDLAAHFLINNLGSLMTLMLPVSTAVMIYTGVNHSRPVEPGKTSFDQKVRPDVPIAGLCTGLTKKSLKLSQCSNQNRYRSLFSQSAVTVDS